MYHQSLFCFILFALVVLIVHSNSVGLHNSYYYLQKKKTKMVSYLGKEKQVHSVFSFRLLPAKE